jgi:hypothetical protein
MSDDKSRQVILEADRKAAIAEFIGRKGVTRCPTACVLPTRGSVSAADRTALAAYALAREQRRQARAAARAQLLWTAALSRAGAE